MSKKVVKTTQEITDEPGVIELDEEEAEGDALQYAPLFDDIERESKHIDKVYVRRTEPDSGFMGVVPPTVTEHEIYSQWGGGTYRLEGKNAGARITKVRSVKLSGDPIFTSDAEERRWRKQNGLEFVPKAGANGQAADGLKVQDVLLLLEEKEDKRRAEQNDREERQRKEQTDREQRERTLREDREVQLQRDRDTREDRLRKDSEEREDRRRRESKEDEERHARMHKEDMDRMSAAAATQLAQAQTFFTQLAATMKQEQQSDPVQTLLAGMQVAREMSGGAAEPGDFLSNLMLKLPETLSELRKTGGAVYQEMSNRKKGRPAGVPPSEDYLTITGPTATRAKMVLAKLQKEGKDPEAVINQALALAAGVARPQARPALATAPGKGKGKTNGTATASHAAKRGGGNSRSGGTARRVRGPGRNSKAARARLAQQSASVPAATPVPAA